MPTDSQRMPELNKIHLGDCLEVMRNWKPNFVDTIITDPPYGLEILGNHWDKGVPGITYWIEMLRIAKPGAYLLAFGGTRTFHRLISAIEDAGWEIRDCLMWLYGSGFPKSLDISKAITKKGVGISPNADIWDGWGSGLKPAWEPICVAMKPLDGTFADNAINWGVAGFNIRGSRIASGKPVQSSASGGVPFGDGNYQKGDGRKYQTSGRWPANLLLDSGAAEALNMQSGDCKTGAVKPYDSKGNGYSGGWGARRDYAKAGDSGGASRFFYVSKADRTERSTGGENDHPTVKPLSLMKYLCNLTNTPTGGIVLDPFSGSGTTLIAAEQLNREWLGIEIDANYMRIADNRIMAERSQLKLAM